LQYSTKRANANGLGADLRAHGDQRALVEILRIDHGAIYIRKDFELIRHAQVIAIREDNP
jgi:hypothetical protein